MSLARAAHPRFHTSLYVKVLIAILIGVILGVLSPTDPKVVPEALRGFILLPLGWAEAMKPFGDGFIKLIRMLIAPIIFCTVVHGIASMQDMKKVGRVGLKALVYFEAVTTMALVIGLVIINLSRPGAGMNIDAKTIDTKAITTFVAQSKDQTVVGTLMHIIPDTVVSAFNEGEVLQVLLFAILFAVGLQAMGERGKVLLGVIEQVSQALFGVVGVIMKWRLWARSARWRSPSAGTVS